jgi:ribosome biogenesis GTPase A
MAKDWRALRQLIKEANVVVEVVDARDVRNTRLMLAEAWAEKKLIIIANKMDLADRVPEDARFVISAKENNDSERRKIISEIVSRTKKRPVKALFIGYPNIGKSSIINMLAKRKAAKVSPVAGTTKNVQWIRVTPELMVTDYRGVYPKGEEQETLMRKGAVNVEQDAELHAYAFAKRVLESKRLRSWVGKKLDMKLSEIADEDELFAAIAKRRKLFIRGGELNWEEAARILVRLMREAPEI